MRKRYAFKGDNEFADEQWNATPIDLVKAEIPSLRRYARSLTRDGERADDLVQDCLVRAIENIDKWETVTPQNRFPIPSKKGLNKNFITKHG